MKTRSTDMESGTSECLAPTSGWAALAVESFGLVVGGWASVYIAGLAVYLTAIAWSLPVCATDYFLTIGGGYSREGNQASLEANVLFVQDVLKAQHPSALEHTVFFADGFDDTADLQYVDDSPSRLPATELLTSLYRRGPRERTSYRNHRVPEIAGPIRPANIRAAFNRMVKELTPADRVFVYVTAHGEEAKGENPFNTKISCWGRTFISAKQFSQLLDKIPAEVPTLMIMAQCYCGGFAHTLFEDANFRSGFASGQRAGFFAQQHDLAAAGCRPDIKNEQEYSSYFWGALTGRSRGGRPIEVVDCNGDGQVSLAEAHAYAVVNSETIDIPLRSSEAVLRVFSSIGNFASRRISNEELDPYETPPDVTLRGMSGSIDDLLTAAAPEVRYAARQLCLQLEIPTTADATVVYKRFAELQQAPRESRFGGRGRGRRSSGRRELRAEIEELWPELGDRDRWTDAEVLRADNQEVLLQEIMSLSSYRRVEQARQAREEAAARYEKRELKEAKLQRLINALESVVLEENLPLLARAEIVDRYDRIVALEQSLLDRTSAGTQDRYR